jgi:hypothetical protein
MSYEELIKLEFKKNNDFSPGIVLDSETIARVIFSPNHYKNGKVLPVAFQQIFNEHGLSTLRTKHDFENSLKETILLKEKDDIKYLGYVCASVEDIRSIIIESFRIFYILDTATSDRIGHSDVFAIRPHEKISLPKKSLKNFIRLKISEVFNKVNIEILS